ncbi:FimV/HubP family polar landmark protein [Marinimicrobium agarilyticum]|uniref:FimV/HubP family polar landmark protein n=1 Tax=Marinimicrobium agarilyticum TaxID=306546 RepID=UPI00041043C9|nr:FimV/HubP family polar landmark protein [Marinimicrobium agarilyticum]
MHLLRKLIFVIGLAMLMVAQQGYALGLGESELHSALNQPLRADIRLTNLRGLGENEIIVRLASLEDFERAGLDRMPFYNQLKFELMLDHPDGPMVRVTTDDPVKEPYLNFLVEARWASGRLLREYTFLLDLPTFDEERQAQPVQAATSQNQRSRASTQPQRREEPSQSRREAPQTPAYAGETYEVGNSDTLWEIALRVRPGRDLSVHQTMLAIQRKNPDAFINGNINLLREGQVLRLPDRSEIQGLDQQRAVREVAEHNREWSEGSTMGAQLDAGQRERSARSGPSEASGQVRLAAPGGSGDAGQGGGNSTDSGAELESELAAAEEELDKTRRENRELSNRVEELESQIETMESLIEASNEQLSALQAAAANRSEAAQQAQVAQQESSAVSSASQSESAEVAQAQASQAPEQVKPEPAAAPEPDRDDRATRVVRSVPEEKTIIDHLMDNLLWVAAGLLAILLAIYGFIRYRASQADRSEEVFEEDFEPAYEEEGFAAESDSEHYDEEEAGIDLSQEEEFEAGAQPWEEDADSGVEAETGDVVGEADIYIAYGKLDQAEELLLKGLEKEPGSPAILSKLLEVYAENRDVAAFDRFYADLLGTDDRMAIQRAGELRDTIPGAGEFDITALEEDEAPKAAESGSDDSYDLSADDGDLDFSFDLDESKDKAEDNDELSLEDDFSFDLDDELDLDETPEESKAVTSEGDIESSSSRYDLSFEETPEEKEDEFALDFDLEDEDSTVTLEEQAPSREKDTDEDEDAFPELDLKLGEDELASESDDEKISADDDWNFDLEADDSTGANLETLDDELSLLDEEETHSNSDVRLEPSDDLSAEASDDWEDELTVHEAGLDNDATSEDEQESGQDAFAELDEALAKATEEPGDTQPTEPETVAEPAGEADLDLDDVDMNDMDLSSLDEEMSGLDADLGEDDKPSAPAQEEELSLESEDPEQESVSADVDEDQMFEEALSGLETEETPEAEETLSESTAEEGSGEDMDAELDFLADTDEAATKLDLARAYIDMGDADGARDILEEVRQEGNEQQQQEAAELLSRIES